ncbi:MAG: hypothetical protein EOR49_35550 [Mesorhizobium sp.]|nr:MAG: hypothetical protein EOR49_35550 [Mesorhizobium sp.]
MPAALPSPCPTAWSACPGGAAAGSSAGRSHPSGSGSRRVAPGSRSQGSRPGLEDRALRRSAQQPARGAERATGLQANQSVVASPKW